MKLKRIVATALSGVLFATSVFAPQVSAAKNKVPSGPAKGSLSSESAIVMELSTGTILYSKNIHEQHYPASITKIMTTLLALENCSLSETLTFTEEEAYGIEMGSSSLYCVPGEKFSIEQALYGIMLQSANEMCLAVADHVAGTTKKFVDMMNDKVASLGLKDTHFMNPNGLHDDNHYTTAYDMAVIAREAWKNTTFQKITGTKTYTIGATNKRKASEIITLLNHHQMINGYDYPQYEYKYCVGGKTGFTNNAQSTLVTYAEKDGMQLVSVIMKANGPTSGEPNEYTDTTRILNYGFENYQKYNVDAQSSQINENLFNTFDSYFNAEQSPIRLANESTVVLPKGVPLTKAKQKITYDQNVTLTKGENIIGTVTYKYGGKTVGATDIIYDNTENTNHLDEASREIVNNEIKQIETKTNNHKAFLTRVSHFFGSIKQIPSFFQSRILLLIALIIVLLLIILAIVRLLTSPKAARRRRTKRFRSSGRSGSLLSNRRSSISFSKRRGRKKNGVDFTSSRKRTTSRRPEPSSSFSVRKSKKNRKKTKESFGKSFYDFK